MKASELRIGNLVYVGNKLRHVCGTIDKTIQHNYHPQNSTYSENYENECEPIPLTEEWLVKFGFENFYNEFLSSNGYFDLIFNDDKVSLRVEGQWLSLEIKYVHQLQNLYFALTNEELTLNK